jgi:hypothetical protein
MSTTASRKAKGRDLQDEVRDAFRQLAKELGSNLEDDDIVGREMGQRGVDVRFSPAAVRVLGNPQVECKNQEKLNAVGAFFEHCGKYPSSTGLRFLVHTRNANKITHGKKQPRIVILNLNDFMTLLRDSLMWRKHINQLVGQEITKRVKINF